MEAKVTEVNMLNKKQLFIRNLAYTVSAEDLEALFQEIGPIKNISIATDHDGNSKGFGFVKFALEDDAIIAMEKFHGYSFQGRKLSLEFGVKKEDNYKRKASQTDGNEQIETPSASISSTKWENPSKEKEGLDFGESANGDKPHINRSRQILVFGVPVDVNKKQFKLIISKVARKGSEVELIKQDHELSKSLSILYPPGKVMLMTLPSRQEALKVLENINKNTIKSLGFEKMLEHRPAADSEDEDMGDEYEILKLKNRLGERLVARSLADVTEIELRKRKCRLIIRNLSFQATQQNVIDKLKRFGPIVEVEIPTVLVNLPISDKMRRKLSIPDEPGATLSKERMRGFAFITFVCEKDARTAVDNSAGLKICNRDIAIDFSMSKESYLKYGKDDIDNEASTNLQQNEDQQIDSKSDDGSMPEDIEESEDDNNQEEEDHVDSEEDIDDSDVEFRGEETRNIDSKPFDGDVNECKTVFVRGLPFDAASIDLKKALGKFGKIEMALIVMDKNTGISKGSAFVKFFDRSSAEKCLEGAKDGILIKDRTCKLDLAVNKDEAAKLKADNKVGKDKRNLYLANEGLVADSSQLMSDHDREKRLRAQSEKKKKLQNPLFFVSNNRLSIRNIGKSVTDQDLRLTCLKATKAGLEKSLVTIDDIRKSSVAQGLSHSDHTVPNFDGRHCIKSAKIMFDPNKVRGGLPQSRGYAFVEFYNHAHALACLRQLNNNPQYENLAAPALASKDNLSKSKLIVEFSLENIRKVKILREREERAKQRRDESLPGKHQKTDSTNQDKRKHQDIADDSATESNKRTKVDEPALVRKSPIKEKVSSIKLQNKKKSNGVKEKN